MEKHLALFLRYKAIFPDESNAVIFSIIVKELKEDCPKLKKAIDLGVCPIQGVGTGTQIQRINRGIALELALREKNRVYNAGVALSKDRVVEGVEMRADYDNPVKTAGTPYEFERIRTKKEDIPALLRAQANAVKHGGNQTFTEK